MCWRVQSYLLLRWLFFCARWLGRLVCPPYLKVLSHAAGVPEMQKVQASLRQVRRFLRQGDPPGPERPVHFSSSYISVYTPFLDQQY